MSTNTQGSANNPPAGGYVYKDLSESMLTNQLAEMDARIRGKISNQLLQVLELAQAIPGECRETNEIVKAAVPLPLQPPRPVAVQPIKAKQLNPSPSDR